jgi:hypothetical protein
LRKIFSQKLLDLVEARDWALTLGLQIRPESACEELDHVPELKGKKILNAVKFAAFRSRFEVPAFCLDDLKEGYEYVRKGRINGVKVISAPHMVFNIGYAAVSDTDFIIPHPQIAISSPTIDKEYLLALSVLLNSSFTQYMLFFNCGSWGIDRSVIGLKEAQALDIPVLNADKVHTLATEYKKILGIKDAVFQSEDIQENIDSLVESLFNIPPALASSAKDFVKVRLKVNKGKLPKSILNPPDQSQLAEYCEALINELTAYAGIPHTVVISTSRNFAYCEILPSAESSFSIKPADPSAFKRIWELANTKCSQWVYVQRSVRIFDGQRVILLKPNRCIDWNRNQAFLDSDDVITEILDHSPEESIHG